MVSLQELSNLPALLHKLRTRVDSVTPGMGSVARGVGSVLGGPAMWALQGAAQPDIIQPPKAPQASPAAAPDGPQAPPTQPMPAMGGTGIFPPAPPQPMDWLKGAQWQNPSPPAAPPQAPPAPATADAGVPMPQARPADAPQAQPDTSFFMRNALMMRDPSTNQLIDPMGASQVRGPDLINKMMAYLHNKDMG